MWEQPRRNLVNNLLNDSKVKCSEEQINRALLGPVITEIITTRYKNLPLQQENSQAHLKKRTLATYEKALSTMLKTLSLSLELSEEILQPHVEKFILEFLELAAQNIDYLIILSEISIQTKIMGISELYGTNFSASYPILARKLRLNDEQLIKKSAQELTKIIETNCPTDIAPMIIEHLKYINEIAAQKSPDRQFLEEFKAETGMTMEEYKHKTRLSKLTISPLLNLTGHFKLLPQLKETVTEQPSVDFQKR